MFTLFTVTVFFFKKLKEKEERRNVLDKNGLLYLSKHLSNQLKIAQDIRMHLNPIMTSLLSMTVKKLLISLIMQISIEKEVDQKASIHMISATYTHPYLIRN